MTRDEFAPATKQQALSRQRHKCASCGTTITSLGEAGRPGNRFGEIAHAHHMRPCAQGGTSLVSNCVVICQSCHYSAHQGGNYRNKAAYMVSTPANYKYFNG